MSTPVPPSTSAIAEQFDRLQTLLGGLTTKAELDQIASTVATLATSFNNLNVPGMWNIMLASFQTITNLEQQILKGQTTIMSALTDIQAGQAAIDKAVTDTITFLQNLATQLSGGISAADAETVTADLNAKAAALEAAIAPPATPPATP